MSDHSRTFVNLEAKDPDEFPSSEANVTNYTILFTHIALKGAQAAALIAPIVIALRYRRNVTTAGLLRGSIKWAGYTAAGSCLVGVTRVWNAQPFEIFDRAYRLNNNASQNRVDRLSLYGAAAGAGLSLVALPGAIGLVTRISGGAVVGLGGGVIAHCLTTDWKDVPSEHPKRSMEAAGKTI